MLVGSVVRCGSSRRRIGNWSAVLNEGQQQQQTPIRRPAAPAAAVVLKNNDEYSPPPPPPPSNYNYYNNNNYYYNNNNSLHQLQLQSPSHTQVVAGQVSLLNHSLFSTFTLQQRFSSSSASPQSDEKETNQSDNASEQLNGDAEAADQNKSSASGNFSDQTDESDAEDDLSRDDLMKLVAEKDELLKVKHKEVETMKDKFLRTYAEMQNVMDRTQREADNSKKFAIQSFAKSLLDVADNMGRASSVVKDSFAKIDTSEDTTGAVPLLKTLLEGVEMTEKQLTEVFKKFGVEKYDPMNEQFDPHRHNAVFQVPDPCKAPDTVAVVLKSGYMLHDRIIRPAEVGVTVAAENKEGS